MDFEEIRDKKLDLLQETVHFYTENPRAISTSGCKYITQDGLNCAAGRLFSDEALEFAKYSGLNSTLVGQAITAFQEAGIQVFSDEYQWMEDEIKFLTRLQHLHDMPCNWDEENKLTKDGCKEVRDIRSLIKRGLL